MAIFRILGDFDPFLRADVEIRDSIICERDSMVMMDDNLALEAIATGGVGKALLRALGSNQGFFQERISAVGGNGMCLLSPPFNGGIYLLNVGPAQYAINDRCFLACQNTVRIDAQLQKNIIGGILGGTGGLLIGVATGQGELAVCGSGKLLTVEVAPDNPLTIDAGHVVAWDNSLSYQLSLSLGKKKSSVLSKMINSVTSGEGLTLNFQGSGLVIVSTRKPTPRSGAGGDGGDSTDDWDGGDGDFGGGD